MHRKNLFREAAGCWVALAGAIGCSFHPGGAADTDAALMNQLKTLLDHTAPLEIDADHSIRSLVFEVPGKLHVYHGRTCTMPSSGGHHVHETALMPTDGADSGAVIFNGAVAAYDDDDHHLGIVAAGTVRVATTVVGSGQRQLEWEAVGSLADNGGSSF